VQIVQQVLDKIDASPARSPPATPKLCQIGGVQVFNDVQPARLHVLEKSGESRPLMCANVAPIVDDQVERPESA
jgi:hypothetical protein